MPPSLATTIGGIQLTSCVYNASGPRSGTAAALSKVCQSRAGGVLAKSATVLKQTGNPQPRTYHAPNGLASFNSEGLPNNGIDYYIATETIDEVMGGDTTKPYMVSISGKTLADNLEMLQRIIKSPAIDKIKAVELNLACPNVIGKPIIAYDFEQMKDILSQVSQALKDAATTIKLGIKLPPYFDGPHFQQAADILNQFDDSIAYVASINTLGNSLVVDMHSEAPLISSNQGFAGLSGAAVKYTALANVRKLRLALNDSIDVVGVGGVESGKDAFELILCGASAIQVGTCHWTEGPKCFDRICMELEQIMTTKGYTTIDDFKGKLKEWSREGADIARAAAKAEQTSKPSAADTKETAAVASSNDQTFLAILVIVIAVLLADKMSSGGLLPF